MFVLILAMLLLKAQGLGNCFFITLRLSKIFLKFTQLIPTLVAIQSGLFLVKIGFVDNHLWLPSRKFKYTSKDTWEAIRAKQPKVE